MRRSITLAAVAMLLAAACGGADDGGSAQDDTAPAVEDAAAAAEEEAQPLTTPVMWHAQSEKEGEVEGATATLETSESEASVRVETAELQADHAYTLWFVIVNNPRACDAYPEPCESSDVLGNPETESQVAYGDGQVADEDGRATFAATFEAGPVPGGWYEGREFTNPQDAEIHISLNDHGPVLDDYMPGMVSTYRAGCTDESLVEAFPDTAKEDGEPGPNTCRLWQSAIFQQ